MIAPPMNDQACLGPTTYQCRHARECERAAPATVGTVINGLAGSGGERAAACSARRNPLAPDQRCTKFERAPDREVGERAPHQHSNSREEAVSAPSTLDINAIRAIFREPTTDIHTRDGRALTADAAHNANAVRSASELAAMPADDVEPFEIVASQAVLDVDDIAALLRVGRNTIYALVARNQIPHRRLGKQIRFSRTAVMSWLSSWSLQVAKEGK